MPSAAQKQRRRKLKQKKETKKGRIRLWQDHQERVKAAVFSAFRGCPLYLHGRSPSERDLFAEQFIPLIADAVQEAAWDLPANAPLDEEAVKEYMMDVIDDDAAPFTGALQIEDIEKYAGFITLATAAYNSPQGTNTATAPAAPPAPVAETAEELRRRARNLRKKLFLTAGLQSRVDAGLDPNEQQVGKLARRGELENELAAVMEALEALPPLESGSDDEATVPDSAASVPADSGLGRRVAEAAAAAPPAPASTPSDVQQGDVGCWSAGGMLESLMNAPGGAAALARALQAREQNAYRAARDDIYDSDDEERDVARRLQGARGQERREREAVPTMEGSWVCTACTFENPDPSALVCDICNTGRPDAVALESRRIALRFMAEESSRAANVPRRDHPATESASAQSVAAQRRGRDRADRDLAATGLWPAATEPPPRTGLPLLDAGAWGQHLLANVVAAPPPAPPPAPAVAAPPPAPPPAPAASQAARPDPPDALVCPISMELMEDPVLAMDGHTYDRSSIEAWLKTGKKTSPKTNAPLPSTALYPNHAVKSMVQDYLETCKKHHC
ncbi:unnamed protein product [Pelagomonas calceolata]|uniref:U-box domain-containing protein n=1 Tax=Pelagomonas calceolata TaxID=35677 RepID=A0A8J2SBU2_9STRA|nr:unnamed protein product [Pelagomonas calceolata]